MSQRELDREIAAITGESLRTIRGFGFSPLAEVIPMEERSMPLVIDWDLEQRYREFQGAS